MTTHDNGRSESEVELVENYMWKRYDFVVLLFARIMVARIRLYEKSRMFEEWKTFKKILYLYVRINI